METPQQCAKNLFKFENKDTRMMSMKSFGIYIVNFEQISHIALAFSLMTLNKWMLDGIHVPTTPYPH